MPIGTGFKPRRSNYLPTLDGWRAIAIIWVLFNHDAIHRIGPLSLKWLNHHGNKGVDIFFAISGILICSRLLNEESISGRVSLKDFYIRRAFRILPAACAYLLAISVLGAIGVIVVYPTEVWSSLLFLRNYPSVLGIHDELGPQAWFTAHFWSLAVEEHFYLLLPALLFLVRNRKARLLWLGGASLVILTIRYFYSDQYPNHTEFRLDALLLPAALAIIMFVRPLPVLRWWPGILVLWLLEINWRPNAFLGTTISEVMLPLIIAGAVLYPENLLGRALEFAPLRYVGKLSYSIYLWQMLFFTGYYYKLAPLGWLSRAPYNYVATFALALASYYLIELPMVRLGHKLAPSVTPGRGNKVTRSQTLDSSPTQYAGN